jgi:hypothetical protein
LEKEVDEHYRVLRKSGEYISELWMGEDYAKAGAKEKALQFLIMQLFWKTPPSLSCLSGNMNF